MKCKESSVVWGLGILFMYLFCQPIELKKLDSIFVFYNIKNKTEEQIKRHISKFILEHNFNRILIKDNYYASDLLQNMLDLDASNRITLQELEEKLT